MKRNLSAIIPILLLVIISAACGEPAANNSNVVQNRTAAVPQTEVAPGGEGTGSKKTETAKEPVHTGACQLAKAPVIDGFSIGQSVQDINAIVPGFEEAYNKEKARAIESNKKINFTLVTTGSLPVGNPFEKANPSKSYIWHFLDDKLMAFVVKDLDTDESDAKAYVNELAKANGLPTDGWKYTAEGSADLSCLNFDVMITSGGQPGNGIMITDKAALKIKEDRIKQNK